ncbi:MAG: long-chain fatty acid--CoA ligase [Ignavibacteria bacterium]|nr:long-chain fatty acid--CoA ligase [Ignavibacteria bacterium]
MMSFDWLAKWAHYTPDKLFLRDYKRSLDWSFSEFEKRTIALAHYIQDELHIQQGQRIAVYSRNNTEYVMLFLTCIKTGAILVPLNFRLTPRELNILLADADPSVIFFEQGFTEQVEKLDIPDARVARRPISAITPFLTDQEPGNTIPIPHNYTEDDVVMILYTAGTTGLSKGVMINHRMLFWNAVNTGLRLDLHSGDHTQSYAPFFHTGGWNVLFTPFLLHGASHTILENFDAELLLQLIEKEKATILFGVPTMLQMMSDLPAFTNANLSSVRYAVVGGAPMPIPLINLWHDKGVAIRQGFGLTEVGPNCFSLHQNDAIRKKGSIGFPNFYINTKIINEHGQECQVNEPGELWLQSPVVTPGYWRKPKETASSITDGFFHTGDIVRCDEDGFFFVVDRKKNMFISGGENVYPAEIEKFLYTHPEVKEVAVIGVKDERWGEVGKACIVKKDASMITESDILNYCKQGLAKYKIPKYIEFVDSIPKTDAGKVNKLKLIENHYSTNIVNQSQGSL